MKDWLFGAKGQVLVGYIFLVTWSAQWVYWGVYSPPTVNTVFHISMEAGVFAAYGIIATGLGYRATERVESVVTEVTDSNVDINVGD